jgi:hypothetical protein
MAVLCWGEEKGPSSLLDEQALLPCVRDLSQTSLGADPTPGESATRIGAATSTRAITAKVVAGHGGSIWSLTDCQPPHTASLWGVPFLQSHFPSGRVDGLMTSTWRASKPMHGKASSSFDLHRRVCEYFVLQRRGCSSPVNLIVNEPPSPPETPAPLSKPRDTGKLTRPPLFAPHGRRGRQGQRLGSGAQQRWVCPSTLLRLSRRPGSRISGACFLLSGKALAPTSSGHYEKRSGPSLPPVSVSSSRCCLWRAVGIPGRVPCWGIGRIGKTAWTEVRLAKSRWLGGHQLSLIKCRTMVAQGRMSV